MPDTPELWDWQHAYRDPELDFMETASVDPGPTAEGIFSSLRHATTSSELKNVISNYLAGGNDPTVLTDILGGIGSFVGMSTHELPTPDAIKGWFKKDKVEGAGNYYSQRFGPWWDRAKEDLAANLYGVLYGGQGDANTTYNSLMNRLITNKKGFPDGLRQKINPQINTLKDSQAMCYELIFSAMSHMSIYGHPDFKAFCVRQLKKEGLTPMQLSYHEGKPFNRLTQKPKYEHYLLDLTIPAESDDHTDGKSGKKRYHLVRGHMMRTREGGFTWRKSHWRGNRKLGVITKDYNIKIDKRIRKEAQAS